jgi:MFS family permease
MTHPEPSPTEPPAIAAPTWLYGITTLPFGVASGFSGIAMPFLLRKAGLSVDRIAEITALCLVPSSYQFLWAPILDLGPRRKRWLVALAAIGSACFFFALLLPIATQLSAFITLAVAGQALVGLTGSCNGGLMATTLPDNVRGSAGGWSNAGNLGGAALGAGATMWLAERLPPAQVGALTAALIFLPSLAVLAVHELPRPRRAMSDVFRGMFKSVWSTLKSRAGITGIIICSSPVGTAAAMNLFSALGTDYSASDATVTFVTGFAGGLVTAVGSLVGGYLCDRMPRRLAYIASGLLTAVCAFSMSFFPLTPSTYVWGCSAYLFIAGLCYASFSALVLEVVGTAGESASTQYTLFTAAANQAIAYTTILLGKGAKHWGGPPGMLRADAAANVAGAVFLGVLMLVLSRFTSKKSPP